MNIQTRTVARYIACPQCDGLSRSRTLTSNIDCKRCGGTGRLLAELTIDTVETRETREKATKR